MTALITKRTLARKAKVSVGRVEARLQAAGVSPDAVVVSFTRKPAGWLYLASRLPELRRIVCGN